MRHGPLVLAIGSSLATLIALVTAPEIASAAPACGDTITGLVKLTADLDCSGTAVSPALTLAARARLDLGGHTLTCAPGGEGIDLPGRTSVVTNGTVTGCDVAVRVGGAGGHTVRKVKAVGNDVGIAVTSPHDQVTDNTITGGDSGITVAAGADNGRIERNRVTGSHGANIFVESNKNLIRNNTASGSVAGSGIAVAGTLNKLINNITADNGADGVEFLSGGVHNKSFHTSTHGNLRGLAIHAGAVQSEINQTDASGNSIADLFDDNPGPPCTSSWVKSRTATTIVGGAGAACIK